MRVGQHYPIPRSCLLHHCDLTNSLGRRTEHFFRHFDDDAPRELDVLRLSARRTDGKAQEVDALALGRYHVDPTVAVDLIQQRFVQLVATLTTQ